MFITVHNTQEIHMAIQHAIDEDTFNHIEAARTPRVYRPRQSDEGTVCKVYPPSANESRFMVCFGQAQNVSHFNTKREAADAIAAWIFGVNATPNQWVTLPIYSHMRQAQIIKVNRTRVRISYDSPSLETEAQGWRPLVHMFGEAIIPSTAEWTIKGTADDEASRKRGRLTMDSTGTGMHVAR